MNVYIPREQGDMLYGLVRAVRPSLTVEVGMANGLSTVFIASALQANGEGRHIAIDPFQSADWRSVGLGLVRIAGLGDLVELREDFGHRALVDMEREGLRPSFAFIDGSHLFDYAMADFLLIDRILPVGGLIAFDDSDWPAVRKVIRYILTNRHYEVVSGLPAIEPSPGRPSLAAKILLSVPAVRGRLRPESVNPDADMEIVGRCVVVRKLADDNRDSQEIKAHWEF